MPKSMTRGPSAASMTLAGLKSRWTTPAWWMAASAVAVPTARRNSSAPATGPPSWTRRCRLGPSMYSRDDVRVVAVQVRVDDAGGAERGDLAGGGDLLGQALAGGAIVDDPGTQPLDRDPQAVGRRGEEHDPLATLAQASVDPVTVNLGRVTGYERGRNGHVRHRAARTPRVTAPKPRELGPPGGHPRPEKIIELPTLDPVEEGIPLDRRVEQPGPVRILGVADGDHPVGSAGASSTQPPDSLFVALRHRRVPSDTGSPLSMTSGPTGP